MQLTKSQVIVALVSGALVVVAACSSKAEMKAAAGTAASGTAAVGTAAAGTPAVGTAAPSTVAVSEGYTATKIQDLVQTDRFKDQKVLLEAAVAKVGCVSCGGVTMVDKTWRISVCPDVPGQLTIPTTPGTRVRIRGVLTIVAGFREVRAHQVETL